MFIALLSFSGSLAIKCILLDTESLFARLTLVDLNPDDVSQGLRHYPFMASSDKCNESCNTVDNFVK